MSYILSYSVLFTIAITFMTGALKYSVINRTFMLLNRGALETSIIQISDKEEMPQPMFSKTKAVAIIDKYLKDNLLKYTTDCYVSYRFYNNVDEMKDVKKEEYSGVIKVSLKCKINYMFTYENARMFSIVESSQIK